MGGPSTGRPPWRMTAIFELGGGSIALSSTTLDAGGRLSGFGSVGDPIASSGVIDARVGKLNLGDAITGSGQLHISRGATLELGGATAETVMFKSEHATLYLDVANDFSGAVAGLGRSDAIDLANFAYWAHPSVSSVIGTGAAGSTTYVTISRWFANRDASTSGPLCWSISGGFQRLRPHVGPSWLRQRGDPIHFGAVVSTPPWGSH